MLGIVSDMLSILVIEVRVDLSIYRASKLLPLVHGRVKVDVMVVVSL